MVTWWHNSPGYTCLYRCATTFIRRFSGQYAYSRKVTFLCGSLLGYPVLRGSLRESAKKKTCQCRKVIGLKVGCFVGLFHHPVMTISAFTHAYRHPLFENGTKQLCEPSLYIDMIYRTGTYLNTMSSSKNEFKYYDNTYTAGYVRT